MIWTLRILFSLIFLSMIAVTTWASLHENMFQINPVVLKNQWFWATMADAYFGFITFYSWVFFRSPSLLNRLGWFIAIMGLGNMAMAGYVLLIVWRLPTTATVSDILLPPKQEPLHVVG